MVSSISGITMSLTCGQPTVTRISSTSYGTGYSSRVAPERSHEPGGPVCGQLCRQVAQVDCNSYHKTQLPLRSGKSNLQRSELKLRKKSTYACIRSTTKATKFHRGGLHVDHPTGSKRKPRLGPSYLRVVSRSDRNAGDPPSDSNAEPCTPPLDGPILLEDSAQPDLGAPRGDAVKGSLESRLPPFSWRRFGLTAINPAVLLVVGGGAAWLGVGAPVLGTNWGWEPGLPLLVVGATLGVVVPEGLISLAMKQPSFQERFPGAWAAMHEVESVTKMVCMATMGIDRRISALPGQAVLLLGLSLFIGFAEELVFRGVLQGGMVELAARGVSGDIAIVVAIAISSLVFGIMHSYTSSPIYSVVTTAIGAIFGIQYALTGNLLLPVLTHALVDFIAFTSVLVELTYFTAPKEQLAVIYNPLPFVMSMRQMYQLGNRNDAGNDVRSE